MGMLASILTARVLGQGGFGEFGMIRSTVLMIGILGGTGLGTAATKHLAEFRIKDPFRAGRQIGLMENVGLALGTTASILCLLLALPLAARCIDAPGLAGPIRIASPLIVLSVIGGIQRGALLGLEAFQSVAWLSLADGLLGIILVVPATWKFGVRGGVEGLVASAAIGIVLKWYVLRRECRRRNIPIRHRQLAGEYGILWSFALPALLIGISTGPFEWLARLPLTRHAAGFDELGVFMAAYSWGPAVMFLPGQLVAPAIPLLANLHAANDVPAFKRLARLTVLASFGLGILAAIALIVFSGGIMEAYGRGFASRRVVLIVLSAAYAVAAGTTLNTLFLATGRMWLQVFHYGLWGTVLVGLSFLWRSHGANGLSLAYLVAYTVLICIQLVFTWSIFIRPRRGASV
jgi:O-antigen/teichoic acid export membrane protein